MSPVAPYLPVNRATFPHQPVGCVEWIHLEFSAGDYSGLAWFFASAPPLSTSANRVSRFNLSGFKVVASYFAGST